MPLPERKSAFEEWYSGDQEDRRLGQSMSFALEQDPERWARVLQVQSQTGLAPQVIERNLETLEQRAKKKDFDPAALRQNSGRLAEWLKDPANAAVAHDDLDFLGTVERIIGNPLKTSGPEIAVRSVQEGVRLGKLARRKVVQLGKDVAGGAKGGAAMWRLSEIKYREMTGEATAEELQEVEGLRAMMEAPIPGEDTWSRGIPIETARMMPMMGASVKGAAEMGVAGSVATGTAVAAVVAGTGVGLPLAAEAGAGAAALTAPFWATWGAAKAAFRMETGLAWDEFQQFRDENGNPLDPDTAALAASVAGGLNALLEVAGERVLFAKPLGKLFRKLPLGKVLPEGGLGTIALKKAMRRFGFRAALKEFAGDWGKGVIAEVGTEVFQEISPMILGEMAKAADEGQFEGLTTDEITDRLSEIIERTTKGVLIPALASPVSGLRSNLARIRAARMNQQIIAALGDAAAESKLLKRAPGRVRDFISKAKEGGEISDVYVPVERWDELWQGQNIDPEEAAREVLGAEGVELYHEAQTTGGDVVIPIERYVEKIAGTENHAALAEDIRLNSSDATIREMRELEGQVEGIAERLATEQQESEAADTAEKGSQEVFDTIHQALIETGKMNPDEAQQNASIWRAFFTTIAQRVGVDPAELFRRYTLTVKGTGQTIRAREAPPVRSTSTVPTLDEFIGPDPKVDPLAANWNEEAFLLGPVDPGPPGEVIHRGPITNWAGVGLARNEYAVTEDQSSPGRALLMSRVVREDGTQVYEGAEQWGPVGEWSAGNLGVLEAHRGHGVGAPFLAEVARRGLRKGPSIGYSPAGLKTAERAHAILTGRAAPRSAAAGPTAAPATTSGAPAAVETFAYSTADPNRRYALRYRVVSLDALQTSHDEQGQPNPAYPAALQQWDRSAKSSRGQVETIGSASSFENMLTEQHALDRGTPIAGEDLAVESGNGRILGLRLARRKGTQAWADYQAQAQQVASQLGLSTEGIQDPVIVRERTEPMSDEQRVEFTRDANARASREPSPVERAKMDAERITPEMLSTVPATEGNTIEQALVTRAGAGWVQDFLATIPTGEQARFMDRQGRVGLHGINAIRLAIFIRTFGDDYGERVLRAMLESPGEAKKNLERAMFSALPRLAKLRGAIDQGALDPGYDITGDIAAAIDVYQRLRIEGTLVSDYLAQQSLGKRELSPFQEQLLEMIDANARRGAQIGKAFDAYVNAALKQPPPGQASLGLVERPTKEQLWETGAKAGVLEEPSGALFQDASNESSIYYSGTGLAIGAKRIANLGELFPGVADNFFGGIWVSADPDVALSHGATLQTVRLDDDDIMSHDDLRSALLYDAGGIDALREIVEDVFNESLTEEEAALLAALVAEDTLLDDSLGDPLSLDKLKKILGYSEDHEVSWALQGIAGEFARRKGYSAVYLPDEHGESLLVVDDSKLLRPQRTLSQGAVDPLDGRDLGYDERLDLEEEMEEFAGRLREETPGLARLSMYITSRGFLELADIEVVAGKRKRGTGSAVLQRLVDWADEKGLVVVLDPADRAPGQTTSRARLVRFYKRFGFRENKGRSLDYRLRAGQMYRLPAGEQNLYQSPPPDVATPRRPPKPVPPEPAYPGKKATPKQFLAFQREREAWLDEVEALGETPFQVERERGGGTIIVHRTINPEAEGGPWRLTWLDPDVGPTGHIVLRSYREALLEASYESDLRQRELPDTTLAQEAYHGGHRFDQFSTAAVGTGEGIQAFGWGLYFAEEKRVARGYADALGRDPSSGVGGWIEHGGKRYHWYDVSVVDSPDLSPGMRLAMSTVLSSWLDSRDPLVVLRDELRSTRRSVEWWESAAENQSGTAEKQRAQGTAEHFLRKTAEIEEAIRIIVETPEAVEVVQPEGQLYKVNLDVKDTDLLDWDKPLQDQHPKVLTKLFAAGLLPQQTLDLIAVERDLDEIVRLPATSPEREGPALQRRFDALQKRAADLRAETTIRPRMTGQQLYETFVTLLSGEQQEASRQLLAAGVTGIKYLDGASRQRGRGTYNYVVFDESVVEIQETYYQSEPALGESLLEQEPAQAVAAIQEAIGATGKRDVEGWSAASPEQRRDLLAAYSDALAVKEQYVGASEALAAAVGGKLKLGPIKTISRTLGKANADYNGAVWAVMDVLRSTVVVESLDAATATGKLIREQFKLHTIGQNERFKDRIAEPTPVGYMDLLANVVLDNGHVAEIQVSHPVMLAAKEIGHKLYAAQQEAEQRGDVDLADRLVEEQRALYLPAGEEFRAAREDIDLMEASTRLRQALSSIESAKLSATQPSLARISPPKAENRPSPGMKTTGAPSASKNRVPFGKTAGIGRGSDMGATSTASIAPSSLGDKSLEQKKRGKIRFQPGGREFEIGLLDGADMSTFMHESAHFFLEVLRDLAGQEGADQTLGSDLGTLLEWFGVESADQITTEHHEQFARGWEAFLMEGKAPSPQLVGVFARFQRWMVALYRELRRLNVTLTEEVRDVMRRLVASEEEIQAAEQAMDLDPVLADAQVEQLSEGEQERYRAASRAARAEARRAMLRQMMADKVRETRQWFREERERQLRRAAGELKATKVYRALWFLRTGRMADGSAVPEVLLDPSAERQGKGVKLSSAALVAVYGTQALQDLQGLYLKKGGVHPDDVAELFGYDSGDAMIQAIMDTEPSLHRAAGAMADERMQAKYGRLIDSVKRLADKAGEALANEQQANLFFMELKHLQRLAGIKGRPRPRQVLRAAAERVIGGKQILSIRPDVYRRAVGKAGREAREAAIAGDFGAARQAAERRLFSLELMRAAIRAREEVDRGQKYLARVASPKSRARIGKASQADLRQIDRLFERFELRKVPLKVLAERRSLREWVLEEEAAGRDPVIPERILDEDYKKNYREMTLAEFRELRDAVLNIDHSARKKLTIMTAQGEEVFEEIRDELLAGLEATQRLGKPLPPDRNTVEGEEALFGTIAGAKERGRRWFAQKDANLLKVEQILEWLDGGRADGPWSRYIWNGIADAQGEADQLSLEVTRKLLEAFDRLPSGMRKRLYTEKRLVKSLGWSYSYQGLIAVALNTGNMSNREKLLRGIAMSKLPDGELIGPQRAEVALGEMLDQLAPEDWDFVQEIWDTLESLWPRIEALEKRLTGLAPPKVERMAFLRHGKTYPGGYYPVVYDRRFSRQGQLQADQMTAELFERGYSRAATPHGHTIARVDFAAPIMLDLKVIPAHLQQVIHDLTHREAVIAAYRLLSDRQIREALMRSIGEARTDELMAWLRHVANDRVTQMAMANSAGRDIFEWARSATVIAAMGYKATTIFGNLAGVAQGLEYVGSKWFMRGYYEWGREPLDAIRFVRGKSREMRHRFSNIDRDTRALTRRMMRKEGVPKQIQNFAFHGIGVTDMMTTIPTWLGQYYKALEVEGMSENDAIHAADRAVRLSHGAGGAKDLTAVQRDQVLRYFTMFYSYFAAMYARSRNIGHEGLDAARERRWKAFPRILSRSFQIFILGAVINEFLAGRGPDDDDDEGWAEWSARKAAMNAVGPIPIVRDVASVAEGLYTGRGARARFSPIGSAVDKIVRVGREAWYVSAGDKDLGDIDAWSVMEGLGTAARMPAGQARITGEYLWDVYAGEEDPENAAEFLRNLAFRRRRKK